MVFFIVLALTIGGFCVALGVPPVPPDPGPPLLRRLTRFEYDHTIHDLLGIDFDSEETVGLRDEPGAQGFDNLAAALNVAPASMEKYLSAADKILDRVIPAADGKVPDIGNRDQAQKACEALFFVRPGKESAAREAARQIVARFLPRAYRRPVSDHEIEQLMALYDRATQRGARFEEALRPALKAALVSPYFLFRVEPNPVAVESHTAAPVDDYALANRLSYFLWSSMPDAQLFDLAAHRQLSQPAVLEQQMHRMLLDPKAQALTENFAAQWLQLRKLAGARPSTDYFPTFTPTLRDAMYAETSTFFDKLREEDKSVLDLLDADYTYLNADLAQHYGVHGVNGSQMQRVKLASDAHRGGLLGMSSILALTSHTYRTSPTLRGKWVLEVIFGTPPPPPPPGVSLIADEQKKQTSGTTFRALLAQHSSNPACAGCHRKMDPLGFALENYDAIGRWRTDQGGKPLDTSAQLPTGEKLNGVPDLKQAILKRKAAFVRNLTEQMLSYALGRELRDADAPTVNQVVAGLQQQDMRFSALIAGIVKSYPFRYRRSTPHLQEARR